MGTACVDRTLNAKAESFWQDHRGAVMVVAVFMAAFLVGSLWYIIGIGDALLYRERMQDGADAVVFSAAVYHARGMNIIAMINIIMAAILGILVAFKLVQLINTIANALSCALAALEIGLPVTAAVCGLTEGLKPPIEAAVDAAEQLVNTALPILSKTQVGIAVAMPWVAEAKSMQIADQHYRKPVDGGATISASLIPFVPQERLGLPVQEDDFNVLCHKAGQYVGEWVLTPFAPFSGWVGGVVGDLVSAYPEYFCGAGVSGAGAGSGAGSTGGSSAGGSSGHSSTPFQVDFQDTLSGSVGRGILAHRACQNERDKLTGLAYASFNMSECEDKTDEAMKRATEQYGSSMFPSTPISSEGKTSKRVFDGARNGNSYFQIWGVVAGDREWPKRAEKGVQIAAWNRQLTMPEMSWGRIALAQAEFYYDKAGGWDSLKDEAMWNMRWRARLRRMHAPELEVGSLMAAGFLGGLAGQIDSRVSTYLDSPEIGSWIFDTLPVNGFEDQLKSVIDSGSIWSGTMIEDPMLMPAAPTTVVH